MEAAEAIEAAKAAYPLQVVFDLQWYLNFSCKLLWDWSLVFDIQMQTHKYIANEVGVMVYLFNCIVDKKQLGARDEEY